MPDAATPLIYVDLLEEEPLTEVAFAVHTGVQVDQLREGEYSRYINRFQPWRIIVRSGGNHKVLFRSAERYFNESDARHAVTLGFGLASNVLLRQQGRDDVVLRLAVTA